MYKTNGTITMHSVDTGEEIKYKGRLELWDYKADTEYGMCEYDVNASFDHLCDRIGRKIKNPTLVIVVDEDDSDYSIRAWVNMKDIKPLVLHQQKIFSCKPEHVESVWLEMPVRARKSLWMRGMLDQALDRMTEGRTKEYARREVDIYWNQKLEKHAYHVQFLIRANPEWFEMEIKDFVEVVRRVVPIYLQSSLYAYYRDHECDWKNTKLRQALYVHKVI